jgi:hypothetical protein
MWTLERLRHCWGDVYSISTAGGKCTATARFGAGDVLTADTPEDLQVLVRRHYERRAAGELSDC